MPNSSEGGPGCAKVEPRLHRDSGDARLSWSSAAPRPEPAESSLTLRRDPGTRPRGGLRRAEGVADKELSALLATDRAIPVAHGTTFEALRDVSPLLAARSGLSTDGSSRGVHLVRTERFRELGRRQPLSRAFTAKKPQLIVADVQSAWTRRIP